MGTTSTNSDAGELLRQIAEDIWEHWLEREVYIRMVEGLKVTELPAVTFEQAQEETGFDRAVLNRLAKVPAHELSYVDQLTLKTLQWDFEMRVEQAEFFWLMSPITPYASPLNQAHQAFTEYPFEENGDLDDYVELLQKYPSMVEGVQARVAQQREKGILLPKEELGLVIPFLQSVTQEPSKSIFRVAVDRLGGLGEAAAGAFQDQVAHIINQEINPALERLMASLSGDYVDESPDAVGLGQYSHGEDYYRSLIKLHTTLPLTPEEIHEMGLAAVEQLDARMGEMRRAIGFEGSKAEFQHFLKTGPRFFAKTPDEVGQRFNRFIHDIEPHIDAYFSHLPQAPYGVKRLEPHLEGAMTFGFYDVPKPSQPVGYYNYNGSDLDQRSLYNAAGLVYHELVPGHHFQIALQMENEDLPKLRRWPIHSAYVEGWAEYAAELAREMGMYQDPYDSYGRLMMDMFLSVRLVVDTGMNYYGWPRERAVKFMKENVLETDTQIHTESLRYSVDMPGQALAYKIGSVTMQEHRRRAESALGDRFDVRQYHDAVLRYGSMPLAILEWHMDNFVKDQAEGS